MVVGKKFVLDQVDKILPKYLVNKSCIFKHMVGKKFGELNFDEYNTNETINAQFTQIYKIKSKFPKMKN